MTHVDMSVDSGQRVLKWKRAIRTDTGEPFAQLIADNMEEAYENRLAVCLLSSNGNPFTSFEKIESAV